MLISRRARDLYHFDADFFHADGHLNLDEYHAARRLAAQISAQRADPVPASDVYGMSLLDEALRIIIQQYVLQNPDVMADALTFLGSNISSKLDELLVRFVD